MLDEEMICNMSKRKLREYLLAHPDEAYEIHSMVDLRSKGFTISDIEELMGECPDFAESIEDIRSTSKIVEWWKKKRAKRTKNVLQCPMC